ncbi:multiple resistance and pH regulation protein F (MrpF / PhaF) superfamily [Wolbachia endosymbiont of Mansonella ozzardi]|nr:multiple resistance and pH regulation protein F (MrpF / PhaF) superfamily [Wolbachia endosymbiont of Mansonella ozzardi]
MIYITVYVLLLCISVMLYRIVSKLSGVYDKVLAFNSFSTQAVLLITTMSIVLNNFFLLDIALLYASISFVSTVALMRLMLL